MTDSKDALIALGIAALSLILAIAGIVLPESTPFPETYPYGNLTDIPSTFPYGNLTGVPSTFPYGNLTDVPSTFPYGNLTGIPTVFNLTDGLILWLPLDDGIGNASDFSGFMNHGVIYNAAWVNGKYGKALEFSGGVDRIIIPDSAILSNLATYTFTCWLYPHSGGGGNFGRLFSKNEKNYVICNYNNQFQAARLHSSVNSATNSITNLFSFNSWIFLTITLNNKLMNITMNMVEVSYALHQLGIGTSIDDVGDLIIGNRADTARGFDGILDDIRFYNRLLNQTEINMLYNLP
jgi:hypothetical protein